MWDLAQNSGKICLQSEDGICVTYSELVDFGLELKNIVGDRCLVFVLCTNSVGSAAGYIAFIEHGIVPVLLGANIDPTLFNNLLALYMPRYVWAPTGQANGIPGHTVFNRFDYRLVRTIYDADHAMDPELGLLLTTSGSTGSPKFVRQSYGNIFANAEQIAEYLQLDSTERPITTLPMNYTYGLSIINSHLLVGATILLTDKSLMQREFWQFYKEEEATSFGGVPYTYEILEKLRFLRMELPSLRYMTQAGGKLSVELHRKFAEYALDKGKKFIVMYGQCEATARMGYLPAEDALRKCGSMGIAIPRGKFILIDEKGQEIAEDEVAGELVYYGPNVTLGYAEKPEDLVQGDEREGRLETGDMAKRDAEGYYYIVGRKKRFLKVYGNRVNLDELDGLIKSQYGNVECACAGVDDHVCIFITAETRGIVQKKNTGIDAADSLREFVSEKTKLNSAAFRVIELLEIPKNDAGKIQYRELEKYYGL